MPFGGLLTAGIGAAGSLFGGLFGSNASGKASKEYIQGLQKAQGSLTDSENKGLANFQPYLGAGANATGMLSQMTGTPGQGLLTPWTNTFQAPTAEQASQTPGYQFQLKAGEDALQNSAAAHGGLLSGGTLAGMNQYAQGLASSNYQNTFNNSLTEYQNAYNSFLNNQNNTYSRLMGISGQGLQAAGGAGNLISGIGGDIASLYGQQGAAQAQGTIGSANSIVGMIPGLTGNLADMFSHFKSGGGGGSAAPGGGGGGCCWVATELYGSRTAPKTVAIFDWLKRTPSMQSFLNVYQRIGPAWAAAIKKDKTFRRETKELFDGFLKEALAT